MPRTRLRRHNACLEAYMISPALGASGWNSSSLQSQLKSLKKIKTLFSTWWMPNCSANQWQMRPLRNAPIICQIRDWTEGICLPFLDVLAEGVVVHHTPIRQI